MGNAVVVWQPNLPERQGPRGVVVASGDDSATTQPGTRQRMGGGQNTPPPDNSSPRNQGSNGDSPKSIRIIWLLFIALGALVAIIAALVIVTVAERGQQVVRAKQEVQKQTVRQSGGCQHVRYAPVVETAGCWHMHTFAGNRTVVRGASRIAVYPGEGMTIRMYYYDIRDRLIMTRRLVGTDGVNTRYKFPEGTYYIAFIPEMTGVVTVRFNQPCDRYLEHC